MKTLREVPVGSSAKVVKLHGEGAAPHADAAHVVGVLVREHERADVALVEAEVVHARQNLAAREAVVDHDEALRTFDKGAVALRSAAKNVQVQRVVDGAHASGCSLRDACE